MNGRFDPYLDATSMADLVRRGDVSPEALVEETIARIEAINPEINAVIIPTFKKARAEALAATGPFRGAPYTLKDLTIVSKGDPYTASIRGVKRARYRATHDSYFTERMRQAGFVLVGRTNTPEMGISTTTEPMAWGPCRNPWDLRRIAGASSGGAAACVAAGMTPVAHGNDGGGSVRMPAALNGVVGLKPTRGRITTGPGVNVSDLVAGDAHEGLITRSIRDMAAVLDIVGRRGPGDAYDAPKHVASFAASLSERLGALRVGVLDHDPTGRASIAPDNVRAVREVAAVLRDGGHQVSEGYPEVLKDDYAGWPAEFMRVVAVAILREVEQFGQLIGRPLSEDDVEPGTWAVITAGRGVTADQYAEGIDRLRERAREIERWWAEGPWDLLLTPTTLVSEPPFLGRPEFSPGDALRLQRRFGEASPEREELAKYRGLTELLVPFNISGQPAITLPTHLSGSGLPIGVQLVGWFGREDLLLRVGQALEHVFDWRRRTPPRYGVR